MTATADVTIARDGPVARVTLDRPQLHNAFDEALILGLTAAFQTLGEDPAVRVVVLTGAGKSFSAGADLNCNRVGMVRRIKRISPGARTTQSS